MGIHNGYSCVDKLNFGTLITLKVIEVLRLGTWNDNSLHSSKLSCIAWFLPLLMIKILIFMFASNHALINRENRDLMFCLKYESSFLLYQLKNIPKLSVMRSVSCGFTIIGSITMDWSLSITISLILLMKLQ